MLPATINQREFTPVTGFDSDRPPLTARQQRYLHASKLQAELTSAINQKIELVESINIQDVSRANGICLEIEGAENIPLDIDFLENRAPGPPIELLNVRVVDGILRAAIYVPDKKLTSFNGKLEQYGDEDRDPAGTKGLTVAVDSIEAIKLAELSDFWMDDAEMPTNTAQAYVWEVWLRKDKINSLRADAAKYGISISQHSLKFQECDICLLTASLDQLALLQVISLSLIGFSYREPAPGFFLDLDPAEQMDWVNDMAARIVPANENSPAVCILDTGVNNAHVLLAPSLADQYCDSYDPSWGEHDHHGHGTQMAGLALLGDLSTHLASAGPIEIHHSLESIKILPPQNNNPEEMYGVITQESVDRATVNAPNKKRVFCLAITSTGKNTNGRPSSWSSVIDKISVGTDGDQNIVDEQKRLFCISVGNIRDPDPLVHTEYPDKNFFEQAENPSQSWNALGVGAITFKSFSEDRSLDGWKLLAQPGQICPTSRTSNSWAEKDWPIKPEIVFEGGNRVSDGSLAYHDPDLSLLTTGHNTPLKYSRDTSAATAEAARMAAIIHASNQNYWPETVRGLMVHSASWTDVMRNGIPIHRMRAAQKEELLRTYGYGMPDLGIARYSADNRACLISQHTIQPFIKKEDYTTSYNEMNVHSLPWPREYLEEVGNIVVRLKVTLSYFVEPNPSKRIPTQKYNYASHGLRFYMQRPLEVAEAFQARINKKDRMPEIERARTATDNWRLGPNARNKGCIISDVWQGTAAELAQQGQIAIVPEGGWWKYRKHLKRTNQTCRYSLIMTLESDDEDIEIYNRIVNEIRLMGVVEV